MNILDALDDNPFITNFASSFCYIGMWDGLYFLHVSAVCIFLGANYFFWDCVLMPFCNHFGWGAFHQPYLFVAGTPPTELWGRLCLVTQMMKPMCRLD